MCVYVCVCVYSLDIEYNSAWWQSVLPLWSNDYIGEKAKIPKRHGLYDYYFLI